jgi:hypothetical protein
MSNEDEVLAPLLHARDRIDSAIQGYLDKVAILRKRRDAITGAMDAIRCGDDEIMKLPTAVPKRTKQMRDFDEEAVEKAVCEMLNGRSLSRPEIQAALISAGSLPFSENGLKRILLTSPRISKTGLRGNTRYHINGGKAC